MGEKYLSEWHTGVKKLFDDTYDLFGWLTSQLILQLMLHMVMENQLSISRLEGQPNRPIDKCHLF